MHLPFKLLGLLADWELKWSPVSPHSCYFSPGASWYHLERTFLVVHKALYTLHPGAIHYLHPPSAVWKCGDYVKGDLACMLHGRESQISIFLITSVVAASRRSSIVMMQTISLCQYAFGWLWTADVNSPVGVVQNRQRAQCWRITEHDIANCCCISDSSNMLPDIA